MIIVTTDGTPGYRVEQVLGEVAGIVGYGAAHLDSGWDNMGSGEFASSTRTLHGLRNQAMDRLWRAALDQGANAVVGMRYDISGVGRTLIEACAYGTAVVVRPLAEGEAGATEQSVRQAAQTGGGPASPQQPAPGRRADPSWLPQGQPPNAHRPSPGFQVPGTQPPPPQPPTDLR